MTIRTINSIVEELIKEKIKRENINDYLDDGDFMFNERQLNLIMDKFDREVKKW